ncbi:PLP-dependent transferase [Inhella gelatinilytica]|uniref:PLP-dependent transferase n=1 Tax=Inhella gelatinilytica TaxID=2795030 RepID=A0A931IWF2_9BURK|nr:PLP-dependent transferase [Inhella gelatinilytica]MBH9554062.1 PLP-dependent transferase [Inhella gelatinilytica]
MTDRKPAAELIHHPYQPPAGFASPVEPVHKGSSIFFPNVAALKRVRWADRDAYTYGLQGTPTTFALEARLATLEGAEHILLAPSGLAALNLVNQTFLKSGDHLLLPDNVYGPSRNAARHELAQWGITFDVYDPLDPADLAARLTPATRLVWLEAAGSVTLEFPDLPALVAAVRERAPQALIALDHTWGAGLAFAPFDFGVDVTIHALTKYPSGGGDVLMGSIGCRDRALYERLAAAHGRSGLGVGANDVELVLRGLATLPLRYAAQDAAARQVAAWAQQHPAVRQVLHPALPGSPGHAAWARDAQAAAGLLTLTFHEGVSSAAVEAAADRLRVFRLAWSWGGPVSLAVPYDLALLRSLPGGRRGPVLRLAIGLEEPEVLTTDLAQALAPLAGG